jgi:hypothetical protein
MLHQNGLNVLERRDFEKFCPSFYAKAPITDVSDQYAFLNTRDIAAQLWEKGWKPVFARESRSIKPENKGFTRHVVRWAHEDFVMNGERIELVGVNSHNKASAFKFMAGVFRLVCANGMIVQTSNFGNFRIIHKGDIAEQVMTAINGIAEGAKQISGNMKTYKEIELTPREQGRFAIAAHKLIYQEPSTAPIQPAQLLTPKRYIDKVENGGWLPKPDLWTTFNVVQENTLKGGLRGFNAKGKRTKTRKINSIEKDVKLNQALWQLTANVADYKLKAS